MTFRDRASTATRAAVDPLKTIPRRKLVTKVVKSGFGLLIMGAGWYMAARLNVEWKVYLPVFGVGAHIFAEDWTRAAVRFLLGVLKEVVSIVRGKNGSPPAP